MIIAEHKESQSGERTSNIITYYLLTQSIFLTHLVHTYMSAHLDLEKDFFILYFGYLASISCTDMSMDD